MLMQAAQADYLNYLAAVRNLSPRTLRNYGNEIKEAIEVFNKLGAQQFSDLNSDILSAYIDSLYDRGLVKASIARRCSELRSFGAYLVQFDKLEENPFLWLRSPKLAKRLPRHLSYDQIEALLDAPPYDEPVGARDRAILETLYAAGLRVSELAAVDRGDIDSDSGRLRVLGKGQSRTISLIGSAGHAGHPTLPCVGTTRYASGHRYLGPSKVEKPAGCRRPSRRGSSPVYQSIRWKALGARDSTIGDKLGPCSRH